MSKAGDRHAGLAARGETEREAARAVLSGLTLQHLYDHPLTDDEGKVAMQFGVPVGPTFRLYTNGDHHYFEPQR